MDSSRRAVESYWRSRMIDSATSDEDKVTPVYKLEEICELLRSSHVSIVKEISEFILKRLEHKSPIVKQKALRLIKYAVGKSGVEFRREMQRHSVNVRQLVHYKGQLDPLKGDALNKAVRDTANETISAIFSAEDNKPAPSEDLNRRIQGFGNTNFDNPSEDKKSFLSEVVGMGSASIKQGLSSFSQSHSLRKNDIGNYRSPNLRKSLTIETEHNDRYEPVEYRSDTQGNMGISKNMTTGQWNQDSRVAKFEITNGESYSKSPQTKTREERLLETIANSGGVRLQPSRDAIQVFLLEAAKLDALAISHAIETKLKSPLWQVRMKAICVLESILRRNDEEHFSIVVSYFSENQDVVVRCSESPQASLREKANKVLILLGGEQASTLTSRSGKSVNSETSTAVQMPDLIDTGDPYGYSVIDEPSQKQSDQNIASLNASTTPLIDDLFGDALGSSTSTSSEPKNDDDPFSGVSFHTTDKRGDIDDLFSGLNVDDKQGASENHMAGKKDEPQLYDIFGTNSEPPHQQHNGKEIDGLMTGLSINDESSKMKEKINSLGPISEGLFSDVSGQSKSDISKDALNGTYSSQMIGINANGMLPPVAMPYKSPGLMFNPTSSSQPINYGAMSGLFAQQHYLATMSNFYQVGNWNLNAGGGHVTGSEEENSSLPDIFQSNFPTPTPSSMVNGPKEDTRAFDFISDHLAAARDPKRLL